MLLVCLGFSSSIAAADTADTDTQTVAAVEPAPPPPTTVVAPAPAPLPPPQEQGMRLRNGFSISAGQEYGSGPSSGLSGSLFGGDWRIGAQIDDLHAVYLHTHLSFGTAHIGAASGTTGNFAAAVIAERQLPMRLFVGGGGGYGVLNNPDGPLAQLRAGWYPFEQSMDSKARRLNVALDARWYFAGDQVGTVTHIALTLGYDRF
jgi:hypothetical protein